MTSRLIQNVTASKTPQQRDVLSHGKSADELLQETISLPAEYVETTEEELNKDNQVCKDFSFSAKLDAKLKNDEVIFYVVDEDGKYRVRAFNAVQGILDIETNEPPIVSFNQQMQGDNISTQMRQIRGRMRMFSQKNPVARKLRIWLSKLQETLQLNFQQQLSCLVINDQTDFEIPWEMLELSDDNYLGASLVTIRWQDIENPDCCDDADEFIPLEFEPAHCYGDIVAYTNTKDLKSVGQEKTLLTQLNAKCFENLYEFLDYLEQVCSEVSLMFIASHGFLGDDISKMNFGEDDPQGQISLTELYGYDLDFFKTCRSIVFMNACHSGRLRRDNKLNIIPQRYRAGFATFFLERGARGVVGTLSKVADQYAAKVTENFFAEYRRNPELSVAAILRKMREQAAKNLKANKTEENQRLFLFTFMYVYYGNPMTVLRLPKTGGG